MPDVRSFPNQDPDLVNNQDMERQFGAMTVQLMFLAKKAERLTAENLALRLKLEKYESKPDKELENVE